MKPLVCAAITLILLTGQVQAQTQLDTIQQELSQVRKELRELNAEMRYDHKLEFLTFMQARQADQIDKLIKQWNDWNIILERGYSSKAAKNIQDIERDLKKTKEAHLKTISDIDRHFSDRIAATKRD